MGSNFSRGMRCTAARVSQASPITLAIALLFSAGASAGQYTAGTEAEFRSALAQAMADGDPSATIRLTSSFTIAPPGTSSFPRFSKPITIDTQGFEFIRAAAAANFSVNAGAPATFNGTYLGESGATPGLALAFLGFGGAQVINNGTLAGGNSTASGTSGGVGVSLNGSITAINNGTIKGGEGAGYNAANNNLGAGITLATGTSVANSATGLIVGGSGSGGMAGSGVSISATSGSTVINAGTIRGGADLSGGSGGGRGIRVTSGTVSIQNSGLIEAGAGNSAIYAQASGTTLSIINSGAIRAGDGYANAIEFGVSGTSTLELQAGSNIVGNVVAGALGARDTFRLGGSANDVFDVSTIGDTAQYRYFDKFEKTGTSTWVLIGDGTVTTPWTVNQGTLQIGNGGSSGSLASDVAVNNDATLAFNRSDIYTFSHLISGTGGVAQNGTGTTVLDTAQAYTGPTTINFGTLSIDGSITSPVTVNTAGTLSGSGMIFGNVTNTGTVTPGGGSGVLTIAGNYIGNGGLVRVNTVFDGDASASGRLVVTGDTSGNGQIQTVKVGGSGAPTVEGIKVIDVQGASNANFTLLGDYSFRGDQAVVAGAYAYRLYKNGVSKPTDGDWYLRSTLIDTTPPGGTGGTGSATTEPAPLLAPTVPLYEAYSGVLQRFNELGTLQQRVGNRSWSPNTSLQAEQEDGKPSIGRGAWARMEGSNTHVDPSTSTTGARYNVRNWKFEGGVDAPVVQNQAGTLVVGPTFHYGSGNASVMSMFGNGSINTTGYGIGAAATWYGNNGSYVDGRTTVTWYDSSISSSTLGTRLVNHNRGIGVATSLEAGHRLALSGNWSITPQAQLAWSQIRFDAFTDQYGANVARDNGDSLVARLGVSLDHETKWSAGNGKTNRSHVYGIANLYYDFLRGTSARVADMNVTSKDQALWAGIGLGTSLNWDDGRYTVYGEFMARTSVQNFGDSHAVGAKFGFRMKW